MAVTDYYANTMLTSLFSNAYIGLSTTTPNTDGTGVTEPASGGYSRVSATSGSFTASDGSVKNTGYIYFPEATADWGTITHLCIFDGSASTARLRYFGKLTEQKAVAVNSVPLFRPKSINISITEG